MPATAHLQSSASYCSSQIECQLPSPSLHHCHTRRLHSCSLSRPRPQPALSADRRLPAAARCTRAMITITTTPPSTAQPPLRQTRLHAPPSSLRPPRRRTPGALPAVKFPRRILPRTLRRHVCPSTTPTPSHSLDRRPTHNIFSLLTLRSTSSPPATAHRPAEPLKSASFHHLPSAASRKSKTPNSTQLPPTLTRQQKHQQ